LRITILGKTLCVLLHFDSSKCCVCPLYKFLYALKVVKLFLKHPVFINCTQNVHYEESKDVNSIEPSQDTSYTM
jgi:hypothetical protein